MQLITILFLYLYLNSRNKTPTRILFVGGQVRETDDKLSIQDFQKEITAFSTGAKILKIFFHQHLSDT